MLKYDIGNGLTLTEQLFRNKNILPFYEVKDKKGITGTSRISYTKALYNYNRNKKRKEEKKKMKNITILEHKSNGKDKGNVKAKVGNIIYNIDYTIDKNNNFKFNYRGNKKPRDIDFEYYLICNL